MIGTSSVLSFSVPLEFSMRDLRLLLAVASSTIVKLLHPSGNNLHHPIVSSVFLHHYLQSYQSLHTSHHFTTSSLSSSHLTISTNPQVHPSQLSRESSLFQSSSISFYGYHNHIHTRLSLHFLLLYDSFCFLNSSLHLPYSSYRFVPTLSLPRIPPLQMSFFDFNRPKMFDVKKKLGLVDAGEGDSGLSSSVAAAIASADAIGGPSGTAPLVGHGTSRNHSM